MENTNQKTTHTNNTLTMEGIDDTKAFTTI